MIKKGDVVQVVNLDPSDEGVVEIGDLYEVEGIDEANGYLIINNPYGGNWWLDPSDVELIASFRSEEPDKPVSIGIDKLIGIINRGDLDVPEILAYLEGYRAGIKEEEAK